MATAPVAKTILQLTKRTTPLTPTIAFELSTGEHGTVADIVAYVLTQLPDTDVPTLEQIVAAVLPQIPPGPTLQQIVTAVLAQIPAATPIEEIVAQVLDQVPAPVPLEDIVAAILPQLPQPPNLATIVAAVLPQIPPVDVAAIVTQVLAQVPAATPIEDIVAQVLAQVPAPPDFEDLVSAVLAEIPAPPVEADIVAAVLAQIPAAPTLEQIVAAAVAEMPTQAAIVTAVLAQVPPPPTVQEVVDAVLPQIPLPPTVQEVVDAVLPQIPAVPSMQDIVTAVVPNIPVPAVQDIVDEVLGQLPDPGTPVFVPRLGMAAIGDSVVATGGEGHRTIPELICGFSDQMWVWRRHFAVGGKRVEQIETEQLPQVFDMDPLPQCLYVGGMYNNLETSESVDAALVVQERIYTKTIAKGIVPIVQLIHPRSETQSSKDQAFRANEGLAKLRAKYNLPVVDLAAALWDPKSYYIKGNVDVNGDPSVTGKMSTDGTHLTFTGNSTAAVTTLADDRFTLLCPRDGGVQKLYNNFDPYNAAVNGLFTLVGGDGAANYWSRNNTAVDAEILYGGGPQGRGNALKVTANASGVGGGLLHDMDISWMNHFRISCTIESDWGGAGACPFNDLLNIYFCSSDYQTGYGTQFALEEPGLPHEKTTIYVEFDRPAGAGRAQLILGAMNANQVPGLTWATISLLKVDKLW